MTPRTRGVDLFVLLSLLLAPAAFAAHSATVTSNYASIYETNSANVTLTVDNGLFSSASINTVNIQPNGFIVTNPVSLLGWNLDTNNSLLFSTTTNAISNWGTQRFGFEVFAGNVNQDTTYTWNIDTTDTTADTTSHPLQFTILNDNTPPVLGATTPGSFILGTSAELFSIQANDAETGIASGNLSLSNCDPVFDNATNTSTVPYSQIPLSCSNAGCSLAEDLSSWNEGDVCFSYAVSNKGGETANSGNLNSIIDRTPPAVSLIAPSNAAFINMTSVDLQFQASDNFDPVLDCAVVLDGNTNSISGNGTLTYSATAADGQHSWNVACTDEVNLTGTSATQTFLVDTQAPFVNITAPSVVDRGNPAVIAADIQDAGVGVDQSSIVAQITEPNGTVDSVSITNNQISYATTTSTEPGTYVLSVTVADLLGHVTTQQVSFRVRETYTITLSLSQQQIDASDANTTRYVNATGTVVKDDGTIPSGTVDVLAIVSNDTASIDNASGSYRSSVEIPQVNGGYTIYATFTSGIDSFTAQASIAVGPYCGNGVVDLGEQCDGSVSNQCSEYGYSQGSVSCSASCTIDTTQCSNPPPQSSSSGGGSSGHHSSSGSFIAPPTVDVVPVVEDTSKTAGIIEQPQQPVQQQVQNDISTISSGNQSQSTTFGLGAAWASLSDFMAGFNKTILGLLLLIFALLYIFGWKKKDENDWDNYFRRYGHH